MTFAKVSAAASNSALASWWPLAIFLGAYGLIVLALLVFGKGPLLTRIPRTLEAVTKIPGWAAASVGTALLGLFIAGQGFYSDVAWHVGLGRDKQLFTAPHTAILVGLGMIGMAAVIGIVTATLTDAKVGFRIGRLTVPWSMLPLGVLGGSAVMGFPLDDVWHAKYGIDVTMWSPTHMLMILGASFSGIAAWVVLAEAGVSPRRSGYARFAHVIAAFLTLLGLAASQGEFTFGVPQFQQLFHPILVCLAAAFAFVATRIVLGPGWSVGIALANIGLFSLGLTETGSVPTRAGGIYIASAVAVELAALAFGTTKRLRFAVAAGIGVATLGLAGEFLWNQGARQPWHASLLPDAVLLGLVVSVGAALVAAAFASAVAREPRSGIPLGAAVVGAIAVIVALAIPMPRNSGNVQAAVHLENVGGENALVHATLTPANAAKDNRWFQTMNWQGGTLVVADMKQEAPGQYVSVKPVPVGNAGKTILRLHRGSEMMSVPIHLPADAEIGAPEIPAVDRTMAFGHEQQYLLRETHGGAAWFAVLVYVILAFIATLWIAMFVLGAHRIPRDRDRDSSRGTTVREPALVG
jgi:hypothetical protein